MVLFALVLLAANPSSPAYEACLDGGDAANGIQSAMQHCADQEFHRQDGNLNLTYKVKMAALPAPKRAILRGMQRQWILDRDRRCKVKGNGSMGRFNAVDCMATETASRTRWLQRYR